jgi:predicted TIM-barrel fold metal-dependent hydrolase
VYVHDGERYLVVDAQVHAWDGSAANQAGPAGEQFVADLHHRHRVLDRKPRPLPADEFERVGERALVADVFGYGHVDRAVLQPLGLGELFVLGFSPSAWHAELAEPLGGRLVVTGELDPGADRGVSRGLTAWVRRDSLRGFALVSARRPETRMALAESWMRRALARGEQAGAGVVHIGVGPVAHPPPGAPAWAHAGVPDRPARAAGRARWPSWAEPVRAGSALPVRARNARPLPAGGFDATELRVLAAALPRVRFVLGSGCLPTGVLCRLARLSNVNVLLTDVLVAMRTHAGEAGPALDALLAAFGPGRLLFGSGYPLVRPERLVGEAVAALRERGLEPADVQAVMGANAAGLYRIPVPDALVHGGQAARAR